MMPDNEALERPEDQLLGTMEAEFERSQRVGAWRLLYKRPLEVVQNPAVLPRDLRASDEVGGAV